MKDYNRNLVAENRITEEMLQWMTAMAQLELGVYVDGYCGPHTRLAMMKRIGKRKKRPGEDDCVSSVLAMRALDIAESHLGRGEDSTMGNNRSEFIYNIRKNDGTGKPWQNAQEWCASYQCYCWRQASIQLQVPMPFEPSRGAKRVIKNALKSGGVKLERPEPGALICWHRGIGWQGHLAVVRDYHGATDTCVTVDANKRKKGQRWAYVNRFTHPHGEWRRRLYAIVRIG